MTHRVYVRELKPNSRGTPYEVTYEGEVLLPSAMTPLFDAARALQERGLSGPLEMWDTGRSYPRMKSTIEAAARLTVRDGGLSTPRITKWTPWGKATEEDPSE